MEWRGLGKTRASDGNVSVGCNKADERCLQEVSGSLRSSRGTGVFVRGVVQTGERKNHSGSRSLVGGRLVKRSRSASDIFSSSDNSCLVHRRNCSWRFSPAVVAKAMVMFCAPNSFLCISEREAL